MHGKDRLILFSPLIAVGFLSRQVFFHLLSDRGFKVFEVLATACGEVLLFRHNLMFVSP